MKKVISIHQPNFIPWIPTLAKENCSDSHIMLDHVEFSKNGWINRCEYTLKDKTKSYLTIPVRKSDNSLSINSVRISNDQRYFLKLGKTFRLISSKHSGYREIREIGEMIEDHLSKTESLCSFNISIHKHIRSILGIETKTHRSSNTPSLKNYQNSTLVERIFDQFEGELYLTGLGGLKYLSKDFINKCKVVSSETLSLDKDVTNTIDFILMYGNESRDRFQKISKDFKRSVVDGL